MINERLSSLNLLSTDDLAYSEWQLSTLTLAHPEPSLNTLFVHNPGMLS